VSYFDFFSSPTWFDYRLIIISRRNHYLSLELLVFSLVSFVGCFTKKYV
jgi:hypothetical protein